MNLIHIVISLEPGGLEKLVIEMTNRRNRTIPGSTAICCLDSAGGLAGEVAGGEVKVINADRTKWPYDASAADRIREVIRQSDGRVVLHAHNLAAWQYAVLAKRGTDAKLVYTQHGANIHNYGLINKIRCYILLRFTDKVIAVSKATAKTAADAYSIPYDEIKVIYNGTGLDPVPKQAEIRRTRRRELGISDGCFVVGSVGRFSPEKNYSLLVETFSEFNTSVQDSKLVLVGDGQDMENIRKIIGRSGMGDKCILPGIQRDPRQWYVVMDVFCLSSISEGVPVSVLEAGSMGIPVILPDVGGCAEIIENGKHGSIVPPSDKRALLEAMKRMYSDAGLRSRMSAEIKTHIEKNFSLDKMMQEYEKIYEEKDEAEG